MKIFYISTSVTYTVPNDGEPYSDEESYTFIISEKSKKIAKLMAKQQSLETFNEEINDSFENIQFKITECYETSDDATAN